MQIIFILLLERVVSKIAGNIVYIKGRHLIKIFPQNKMAKKIHNEWKKVTTRDLQILDLLMSSSLVLKKPELNFTKKVFQ